MGSATRFNCPNCGALYEVVHVEAENVAIDRELACLSCGGPIAIPTGPVRAEIFSPGTFILGGYNASCCWAAARRRL
jgi:ribosomal protein S27E